MLNIATSSAEHFTADLVGSLSVPSFYQNFDAEKQELTNKSLKETLNTIVNKLVPIPA